MTTSCSVSNGSITATVDASLNVLSIINIGAFSTGWRYGPANGYAYAYSGGTMGYIDTIGVTLTGGGYDCVAYWPMN